jgi:peptide-methionine (R)-S-oxide reductase
MKTGITLSIYFSLVWILCPLHAFRITLLTKNKSFLFMSSKEPEKQSAPWQRQTMNPLRLLVLKLGFTEPAWTSPWNYQKTREGKFVCAYCGNELFDSSSKYESGSGWPSFWRSIDEGAIRLVREYDGRVECSCSRCKSHLGHVFLDGPRKETVNPDLLSTIPASDPKGGTENSRLPRFCINGASIMFRSNDYEKM